MTIGYRLKWTMVNKYGNPMLYLQSPLIGYTVTRMVAGLNWYEACQ